MAKSASSKEDQGGTPWIFFLVAAVQVGGLIYVVVTLDGYWVIRGNAVVLALWGSGLLVWYSFVNPKSDKIKFLDERSSERFLVVERYDNANCRTVVVFVCLALLSFGLTGISQINGPGGQVTIGPAASQQWAGAGILYLFSAYITHQLNTKTSLHEAFKCAMQKIPQS